MREARRGGGRRTGAMAELSKLGDLGRSGEGGRERERTDGSAACETCVCVRARVLPGWPFNDLQKTSLEAPDGSVLKTFTVG